jgi:hypothetical protein
MYRQKSNKSSHLSENIQFECRTIDSGAIILRSDLRNYENSSLAGKYLMRHCNAVVSYVFPFKTNPEQVFHKQLCITDFYEDFRDKMNSATGIIQDIYTPPAVVLRHFAPTGLKLQQPQWQVIYRIFSV